MGKVFWFTGLSGSGKTTIAKAFKTHLENSGKRVLVLDADVVRATLHHHLGFSREDIRENNRLTAQLAKEKMADYDVIVVPIISPFREDRKTVKEIVGKEDMFEVYINCPLEECMKRDPKGLYAAVQNGTREPLIGMDGGQPYESPTTPDIEIKTLEMDIHSAVAELQRRVSSL